MLPRITHSRLEPFGVEVQLDLAADLSEADRQELRRLYAEGAPSKTRRGEPSLTVDELTLLAKIRRPLPDTFHGVTDTEKRYRQRYLDLLMNEASRADFLLRARMVAAMRAYLDGQGFAKLVTAGWVPVELLYGMSIGVRHDDYRPRAQTR